MVVDLQMEKRAQPIKCSIEHIKRLYDFGFFFVFVKLTHDLKN